MRIFFNVNKSSASQSATPVTSTREPFSVGDVSLSRERPAYVAACDEICENILF